MRRVAALLIVGLLAATGCGKPDDPPARTGLVTTTTMSTTTTTSTTVVETTTTHPPSTTTTASPKRARGGDVWYLIALCETGGKMDNPNTGNGYYGYFQFDLSSWQSAGGGPGLPSDYTYEQQKEVAIRWQQMRGWSAWPHCRHKAGV